MRKYLLLILVFVIFSGIPAHGQDTGELVEQVARIYTGETGEGGGILGHFSLWGLIFNFIFSGIGFIAFMYGKKNSESRPMMIGILLMIYPYFLRSTFAICAVGVVLVGILKFWKE